VWFQVKGRLKKLCNVVDLNDCVCMEFYRIHVFLMSEYIYIYCSIGQHMRGCRKKIQNQRYAEPK
jgi:hypothetical protein